MNKYNEKADSILDMAESQASDDYLVKRLKEGDRDAFRMLALRYGARYRSLAFRYVGEMALAEDLVQEAFVKLWTNAHQFDGEKAKFTTWFHRVVVNKCLDEKRKRTVDPLPEGYDKPDTSMAADDMLVQDSVSVSLSEALSTLPDRQKTAMVMSYFEGLSNQEAADAMGLNIKAYESLLVRARGKMKKLLVAEKTELLSAFG